MVTSGGSWGLKFFKIILFQHGTTSSVVVDVILPMCAW